MDYGFYKKKKKTHNPLKYPEVTIDAHRLCTWTVKLPDEHSIINSCTLESFFMFNEIRKEVPNLETYVFKLLLVWEKTCQIALPGNRHVRCWPLQKLDFFLSVYILLVLLRSLGQGFIKPVFRRMLDSFLEGTNIWFSFYIRDLDSKDSICVWSSWKEKIWLVNGLPNMWSKESMNSRQMKTDILFSDFPQVYKL